MNMKKFWAFLLLLSAAPLSAAPWFVYSSLDGVKSGEWTFEAGTSDGILVLAKDALKHSNDYVLGDWEGGLFQSSLSRLDNEVNAALLKPGDPIKEQALRDLHQSRAERLRAFLPAPERAPLEAALKEDTSAAAPTAPSANETFEILINGARYEGTPFVFPVTHKESEFTMEVINRSTESVWRVNLEMEADPNISFWKKGRNKGLNAVPRRIFRHNHQSLFKQLKQGDGFTVPVEVFYIKEKDYTLAVRLESKIGNAEFLIPISFSEEVETN